MIIPGILEETFEEARKKIFLIEELTPIVQVDIADGKMVGGKTFLDVAELNSIEPACDIELHLMVEDPALYMEVFLKHVTKVSAQIESYSHIGHFMWLARERGYKTGVSLNPETPIETLNEFIKNLDFVQFMSVEPGKQGNKFDKNIFNKIKKFKQQFPNIALQIDGGISDENLAKVLKNGVNDVVIGSSIFGSEDPRESLINLQKTAYGYSN